MGTGRTRGLLSHSNVSSYRRAINKPGVRAGGGALHTSSAGQGPGSRRSRGDPPRAKEAPGSCQSCSGARGSTAASWGCSSSQGFDPGPRFVSVLQSPRQSPARESLLLLLAELGSLCAFQQRSWLGQVLHSSLVGASLLAKSMPGPPRRRRTSDGGSGWCSSTRLPGLLVPSAPSSVPSAAPRPWPGGTSRTASSHQLPGRPPLPNSM